MALLRKANIEENVNQPCSGVVLDAPRRDRLLKIDIFLLTNDKKQDII